MKKIQLKRTKRLFSLFLVTILMLSPLVNAYANQVKDITGHWASEVVNNWLTEGLASGYPDGSFKPDSLITRAEFMSLANKAFGYSEEETINFKDVFENDWYAKVIRVAIAAGYIEGYPDGIIKPKDSITRQEVAIILSRIKGLESKPSQANIFTDFDGIPDWSIGQIGAVAEVGYMLGYSDNSFRPTNFITRAEAIVALDRALKDEMTQEDESLIEEDNLPEAAPEIPSQPETPSGGNTSGGTTTVAVSGIRVTPETMTLTVGGVTGALVATVSPSNATNRNVNWTSDNEAVATVNGGIVTPVAEGTATITVTSVADGTKNATCVVTVESLVDAETPVIEADLTNHTVAVNDTLTLDATATVSDGGTISYKWYMADNVEKENPVAITTVVTNEYEPNTSSAGTNYYYCTITNTNNAVNGNKVVAIDTAVSTVIIESIIDAQTPVISVDLVDHTVAVNDTLTLDATATVSDGGTIGYQWYRADNPEKENPQPITSNAIYTVDTTSAGTNYYYCTITNTNNAVNGNKVVAIDTAVSTVIIESIIDAQTPVITVDLANHTVAVNETLTLDATATVSDGGTISYQWYRADNPEKENPQATTTNAIYTVETSTAGTGYYYCTISNTNNAVNGNKTVAIDTAVSVVIAEGQMTGSGTEADPFIIMSVEDLRLIGTGLNSDGNTYGMNNSYKLGKHLDFTDPDSYDDASANMDNLSGWDYVDDNTKATAIIAGNTAGFEPIGNEAIHFIGSFDGDDYTISHLYINRTTTNSIGLFGRIEGASAKISNLGLVNVDICGLDTIGGLVGLNNNNATVSNSYVTGIVSGNNHVGGLVGHIANNATVSNSYATGNVTGNNNIGGLVGYNSSTISSSYATGIINGVINVGGLVGTNDSSSSVSNSYATGVVSGDENVGGLVGNNKRSTVSNSYASGAVGGDENVGGLVGNNYFATTNNSYSIGNVTGNSYVGGLVGLNQYGTISNSYAIGVVSGDNYVGGLVGHSIRGTEIVNCVAFNSAITGETGTSRVVGSQGGTFYGPLTNNYANGAMTVNGSPGTVGTTTDRNGANILAMTNKDNEPLLSWEFDADTNTDYGYWKLLEGANRPILYTDPDGDGVFTQLGSDNGQ